MTHAELRALLDASTPGPVAIARHGRPNCLSSYRVQNVGGQIVGEHDDDIGDNAKADAALHDALRNEAASLIEAAHRYATLVEMANSHHEKWATIVVALELLDKELSRG